MRMPFVSLALDLALPAMGFVVGFGTILLGGCDIGLPHASGPPCSHTPFKVVFGTSLLLGPLVDGLAVAWEPKRPRDAAFALLPVVTPLVDARARGATFGVGGTF